MIKYLALGDSYTIGEGAEIDQNWPSLLTNNLNQQLVPIELIGNPSVTGWTTTDLIQKELHFIDNLKPDFITLLIGVNDWVQGVSKEVFKNNFNYILDYILLNLSKSSNLVVVTIPDFGVSPDGYKYGYDRDISRGLQEYNTIIKDSCNRLSITAADIYPISKRMADELDLVAKDNIHGSAKMYKLWEQVIYPYVHQKLVS